MESTESPHMITVSLKLLLEIVLSMWLGTAILVGVLFHAASRPSWYEVPVGELTDDADSLEAPAFIDASRWVAPESVA
jgi:hypothetical protein